MTKKRVRVYVTVKTYPTISKKYAELVCTAGLLEDGTWIRLYPMPFRLLKDEQKYPKYTWMDVVVEKNIADFRKESYRPDLESIIVKPKPKRTDWDYRKSIILEKGTVYTNLGEIIRRAKSEENMSLATFKPTKVLGVKCERAESEWDRDKIDALQMQARQMSLFQSAQEREEEFRLVDKIPYNFSYRIEDDEGRYSEMMIEDWEIGMLYRNCRVKHDEETAIELVKNKYYNEFIKRDLYFFPGTTKHYHKVGKNPYIVIGVFPPPLDANEQLRLF